MKTSPLFKPSTEELLPCHRILPHPVSLRSRRCVVYVGIEAVGPSTGHPRIVIRHHPRPTSRTFVNDDIVTNNIILRIAVTQPSMTATLVDDSDSVAK